MASEPCDHSSAQSWLLYEEWLVQWCSACGAFRTGSQSRIAYVPWKLVGTPHPTVTDHASLETTTSTSIASPTSADLVAAWRKRRARVEDVKRSIRGLDVDERVEVYVALSDSIENSSRPRPIPDLRTRLPAERTPPLRPTMTTRMAIQRVLANCGTALSMKDLKIAAQDLRPGTKHAHINSALQSMVKSGEVTRSGERYFFLYALNAATSQMGPSSQPRSARVDQLIAAIRAEPSAASESRDELPYKSPTLPSLIRKTLDGKPKGLTIPELKIELAKLREDVRPNEVTSSLHAMRTRGEVACEGETRCYRYFLIASRLPDREPSPTVDSALRPS